MGIKELRNTLEASDPGAFKQVSLESDLKGKIAAVDAFAWLHRFSYKLGDKIYFKEEGGDRYIRNMISNIKYLIQRGITPIMVFDGRKLPAKAETNAKRRELVDCHFLLI